jgi:hypothetical protein
VAILALVQAVHQGLNWLIKVGKLANLGVYTKHPPHWLSAHFDAFAANINSLDAA